MFVYFRVLYFHLVFTEMWRDLQLSLSHRIWQILYISGWEALVGLDQSLRKVQSFEVASQMPIRCMCSGDSSSSLIWTRSLSDSESFQRTWIFVEFPIQRAWIFVEYPSHSTLNPWCSSLVPCLEWCEVELHSDSSLGMSTFFPWDVDIIVATSTFTVGAALTDVWVPSPLTPNREVPAAVTTLGVIDVMTVEATPEVTWLSPTAAIFGSSCITPCVTIVVVASPPTTVWFFTSLFLCLSELLATWRIPDANFTGIDPSNRIRTCILYEFHHTFILL